MRQQVTTATLVPLAIEALGRESHDEQEATIE
jgi:hypothetical protein